jgi:SprB repeat
MSSFKNSFLAIASFSLAIMLSSCGSDGDVEIDCTKSGLVLKQKTVTDISCADATGKVEVSAEGGTAPYTYDLAGVKNTTGIYSSLGVGKVTVKVTDANLCEATLEVEVKSLISLNASVTSTPNNLCLTSNGSITVSAALGKAPYQFQLDGGSFGSVAVFSNVKNGDHTVKVKDAEGCLIEVSAPVARGNTGISFANEIKTNCAVSGCHNGSLGESRNWSVFATLKSNASNVKERTTNKSMPPAGKTALTTEQIAKIACWVEDGAVDN